MEYLRLVRRGVQNKLMCASLKHHHFVREVEADHDQQHHNRTKQRIEKEFYSCVFSSCAAPNADEKVHRQQHELPEDIKEEEVERAERPHAANIEQEIHEEVSLNVALNGEAG